MGELIGFAGCMLVVFTLCNILAYDKNAWWNRDL